MQWEQSLASSKAEEWFALSDRPWGLVKFVFLSFNFAASRFISFTKRFIPGILEPDSKPQDGSPFSLPSLLII